MSDYYSDVLLCMNAEISEKFKRRIAEVMETEPEIVKCKIRYLLHTATIYQAGNDLLLLWQDIRWNPQYPEIGIIAEFLNEREIGEDIESYYFGRIGEDYTDVEQYGYYEGAFSPFIQRTFKFFLGAEKRQSASEIFQFNKIGVRDE